MMSGFTKLLSFEAPIAMEWQQNQNEMVIGENENSTASNEMSAEIEEQTRQIVPESGNCPQVTLSNKFESILKTKPRGKTKMQVDKYEQRCQKQLDQISKKMNAISNK